jgi:8-oxo-dGTP diphosphatase
MRRLRALVDRAVFRVWRRSPLFVRLFAIRRATPSYAVGAMCVIERADGALLLVRNSYRMGWGLPGGFLKRGEAPVDAVRREIREEVGVDIDLDDNPKVVVDPSLRRVDVIFTGRPAGLSMADVGPAPRSTEILEVKWFPATALPELQVEAAAALIEVGRSKRPPASPDSPGQLGVSG